ncbi:1,4-alpha-glucan branching protein GlgB [candidate division KSB1 bacterium]|nr:1,4-alpha-glucan branching protein GlgB [candidate division KSB1 bacterium]
MSKLAKDDVLKIIHGDHSDPFKILGLHEVTKGKQKHYAIRVFVPTAKEISVISENGKDFARPMEKLHNEGFFELLLKKEEHPGSYKFRATDYHDSQWEFYDPYSYSTLLTDFDMHLFGEGNFFHMYEKFGAHPMEINGIRGVQFVVWAPNANRVAIVGDFNAWDGRRHPMRVHPGIGVWEIFLPEVREGATYKYEIKTKDGHLRIKTDPVGFRSELRPANASIVYNIENYNWSDENWMSARRNSNVLHSPISVYEVHLGSWKRIWEENNRWLTYRELAHDLAEYVKSLGFTHIELMPVSEHPFDGSWGYQTTGYYAPTSRYGSPDDFKYFVDHMHQNGIGVILDWVPAHFPKDDFGLRLFDGTALYEHSDPRQGEHPDWGTLIFNYGRNEVRNFLISNALFWLDEYHIDGLRVDAVASMLYLDYSRVDGGWIPNKYGGRENLEAIAFLKQLNETVYAEHPNVLMIAEESTSWPGVSRPTYVGGLGFGLKWNMGWMNDFLEYIEKDPIHRHYHHDNLTFGLVYAFTENFQLVLSHDEVVHGKRALLDKMPGDLWQKFANLRLSFGFMFGHPGKKLLFMGAEIGQWDEWMHTKSLDWHLFDFELHRGLQQFVKDLNHLYTNTTALWEDDFTHEGFQWIDFQDSDNSILSFIRKSPSTKEFVVVVCNFTPVPRSGYRVGVPEPGYYEEILNSDSQFYGGSNMGNDGGLHAQNISHHGFAHSLDLIVPPLATIMFKLHRI